MKANELMVGDWVRVKAPYFKKNKAYRVVEVREHGYNGEATANIELPDEDDEASMTGEYIIGIPITPEILEKNGFYDTDVIVVGTRKMRWQSDDTRTEITIWLDDTLPMEILKNVYYEDEVSYTLPFPGTVHLLQHALRLCGIEKEIVI